MVFCFLREFDRPEKRQKNHRRRILTKTYPTVYNSGINTDLHRKYT